MLFFPDANAAVPVQVWQIMYKFEDFNKQKPTFLTCNLHLLGVNQSQTEKKTDSDNIQT